MIDIVILIEAMALAVFSGGLAGITAYNMSRRKPYRVTPITRSEYARHRQKCKANKCKHL